MFLKICAEEEGRQKKDFFGKFEVLNSPNLHEKLVISDFAAGKSINQIEVESLLQNVSQIKAP